MNAAAPDGAPPRRINSGENTPFFPRFATARPRNGEYLQFFTMLVIVNNPFYEETPI